MVGYFLKLIIVTLLPFPNSVTLYAIIHDIFITLYPFIYGLIYNEWKRKKRSGADTLEGFSDIATTHHFWFLVYNPVLEH